MPYEATAFQRLLEPLDRRVLRRIVGAHGGNHGVGEGEGAWTCQRHLKALLFAQFAGLESLREIEQALSARPAALYHLGLKPARRSTLSDASAQRPAAVFCDIGRHLMAGMTRRLRREGEAVISLLDASPVPLRDARFTWAEADSRVRGLKLFVCYDPGAAYPTCFDLTSPKTSDTALARTVPLEANTTYVFDKGFTDYGWWQDIIEAGAIFVTRLKKNAHRRQVEARIETQAETGPAPDQGPDLGPDQDQALILADNRLKIGHRTPRGGAQNALYDTPLREIVVDRDGKPPLHLITNDLERPATDIAGLYKRRWQIELFFKWIKQNLKIKRFFGRSENAVKIQLYAALIAFLLINILKQGHAKAHKGSTKNLMARLAVALFSPIDLSERQPAKPRPPNRLPPKPQIEMAFS